jgi:hypothetical protein
MSAVAKIRRDFQAHIRKEPPTTAAAQLASAALLASLKNLEAAPGSAIFKRMLLTDLAWFEQTQSGG